MRDWGLVGRDSFTSHRNVTILYGSFIWLVLALIRLDGHLHWVVHFHLLLNVVGRNARLRGWLIRALHFQGRKAFKFRFFRSIAVEFRFSMQISVVAHLWTIKNIQSWLMRYQEQPSLLSSTIQCKRKLPKCFLHHLMKSALFIWCRLTCFHLSLSCSSLVNFWNDWCSMSCFM